VSAARLWCRCAEGQLKIISIVGSGSKDDPPKLQQGKSTPLTITATSEKLVDIYAPRGVHVGPIETGKPVKAGRDAEKVYTFQVTVDVEDDAPIGIWTLTVTSQECSLATHNIEITGKQTAGKQ
jgi:hypothetical protein